MESTAAHPPVRRLSTLVALPLALPLWLAGAPGLAQKAEEQASFTKLQQQGLHYFNRKMYGPAIKTLEQAAATPRGKKDYRTQYTLARAYYEQLILEKAVPAALLAVELASTDANKEKAQAFLDGLTESFGAVTFQKDPEQKTELKETYIHLKDQGGLINEAKKKVFQSIQKRFLETKVPLPITLYLPFGRYTANGAPFETKKGETAEANLFLYGSPPGGIAWYWWAGGAAVVAAGATVAVLLLTAEDEEVQTASFEPVTFLGGAQ